MPSITNNTPQYHLVHYFSRMHYRRLTSRNIFAIQRKKVKPLIYIVLAVVSLVMLIFIAIVTWKLVSLDKALTEERQTRILLAPMNVSGMWLNLPIILL